MGSRLNLHFPCALGWGAVVVGPGLCTGTPMHTMFSPSDYDRLQWGQ